MSTQKLSGQLDKVFSSLSDPTRRKILQKVREKQCTVLEIASDFNISLPAVSKHIKILGNAGLLIKEKSGKYIICTYNNKSLIPAMKWISEQYDIWNKSFEKLDSYLSTLNSKKHAGKEKENI